MLTNYYSSEKDNEYLFEIKNCSSYNEHVNKYNVFYILFDYNPETYTKTT